MVVIFQDQRMFHILTAVVIAYTYASWYSLALNRWLMSRLASAMKNTTSFVLYHAFHGS